MIAALLGLAIWANERIYSGYLSYAPLERVVTSKGWQGTDAFPVLLATPDCGDVARWAWIITEGEIYSALIVDCSHPGDREAMIERRLVADCDRPELVHRWAWVVVR